MDWFTRPPPHRHEVLSAPFLTLPLTVWMLAGFFRQIPRDLEEAAAID